jgi:hypothetical protein
LCLLGWLGRSGQDFQERQISESLVADIPEYSGAGICNASAAAAIDEKRITVGDDEKS